jgi:hypothetical protein
MSVSIPLPVTATLAVVQSPSAAPPATLATPAAGFGVLASIGAGIWAGAVIVTLGLLVFVFAAVAAYAARKPLRRALDRHLEHKARAERRRMRGVRLEEAGVSRDQLAELTILADEIERRDPSLARRYDLDEMLDRHVELSLAHERCLRAMRMCDREQLARARREHLSRPDGSHRRADMFERRMKSWDRCKAQADRCDEELAVLADMMRLLAQTAICPPTLVECEPIEHGLDQLDDEHTALHQLSMLGS